jgi:hypothetical protein
MISRNVAIKALSAHFAPDVGYELANKIVCNMKPYIRDMLYLQHIMVHCEECQ